MLASSNQCRSEPHRPTPVTRSRTSPGPGPPPARGRRERRPDRGSGPLQDGGRRRRRSPVIGVARPLPVVGVRPVLAPEVALQQVVGHRLDVRVEGEASGTPSSATASRAVALSAASCASRPQVNGPCEATRTAGISAALEPETLQRLDDHRAGLALVLARDLALAHLPRHRARRRGNDRRGSSRAAGSAGRPGPRPWPPSSACERRRRSPDSAGRGAGGSACRTTAADRPPPLGRRPARRPRVARDGARRTARRSA